MDSEEQPSPEPSAKPESINGESPSEQIGADAIAAELTADSEFLPKSAGSPDPMPTPTPMKGYGLKKWRRIRRDTGTDPTGGVDSAQILKRRLSLPEPVKARGEQRNAADVEVSAASDVASTAAVVTGVLDPELVHLVASGGFSVGADSDNSEDRSSKSSTAASGPRLRQDAGSARERGRGKGVGARHAVQQRSQRGRGSGGGGSSGADASKKFRGDQFNKETPQSSVESDLRSSNAGFVRWGSVVSSNGKQSEVSVNDDGDQSDGAQTCEESKLGYFKENGRVGGATREEFDDDPQEEENAMKSGNGRHRTDLDPFLESIVLLQAAQEALETEIQKFGEIGKDVILTDTNGLLEGTEGSSSPDLDVHFLDLNQKIKYLELRLEEASATIKAKDSKILELEFLVNKTGMLKQETESTVLEENCKDMELELEALVKRKIEAEVEYLITANATQNLTIHTENQIALLEQQKSLAKAQAQMMLKLRDAESKASMLKEQAEELEVRCKELVGTEDVLRLQSKVCRSSVCLFTQFAMVCVALWWFLVHLLLPSDGTVPT